MAGTMKCRMETVWSECNEWMQCRLSAGIQGSAIEVMTIILFLIDTSGSMNQRTHFGARPTLLDVAKDTVEKFLKVIFVQKRFSILLKLILMTKRTPYNWISSPYKTIMPILNSHWLSSGHHKGWRHEKTYITLLTFTKVSKVKSL